MKFTILTRDASDYLTDRFSERRSSRRVGETGVAQVDLTDHALTVAGCRQETATVTNAAILIAPRRAFAASDMLSPILSVAAREDEGAPAPTARRAAAILPVIAPYPSDPNR